ncbi:MAG: signal peptidase I [Candidatus Acidiferrales bacterium]
MASDTTSLPAQAPDIAIPAASGAPAPPRKIARPRSGLAEFLEMLLVTMLLALFGTTFVVQAFKIPSGSMEPTLLIGDHVFVNKFIFEGTGAWYEKFLPYRDIRRGDIIVFKFPFDDHPHYVKRVIGLPGDRLRIVNGDVYIDGVLLQEPYVVHDPAARDPYADNFPPTDRRVLQFVARREWADQLFNNVRDGELIVPPNHYFAMGDNRDRSADSRYWGFVDRDSIMGRPMVIYWSVRATSDDYRSRGVSSVLSGMGQTLLHLRAQTRWDRMLREVH